MSYFLMCVCIGGMLKFLFVCLLFFVCRLPVYVDCIRTRASVEGHGHTYEGTHTHTHTHTDTDTDTHTQEIPAEVADCYCKVHHYNQLHARA